MLAGDCAGNRAAGPCAATLAWLCADRCCGAQGDGAGRLGAGGGRAGCWSRCLSEVALLAMVFGVGFIAVLRAGVVGDAINRALKEITRAAPTKVCQEEGFEVQNILRHRHPNQLRVHKRRKDRGGAKRCATTLQKCPPVPKINPMESNINQPPKVPGSGVSKKQKWEAKHCPC